MHFFDFGFFEHKKQNLHSKTKKNKNHNACAYWLSSSLSITTSYVTVHGQFASGRTYDCVAVGGGG
jgi:hypothetical protein